MHKLSRMNNRQCLIKHTSSRADICIFSNAELVFEIMCSTLPRPLEQPRFPMPITNIHMRWIPTFSSDTPSLFGRTKAAPLEMYLYIGDWMLELDGNRLRAIKEPEIALDLLVAPKPGWHTKEPLKSSLEDGKQPVEAAKRKTNHDHQRQLPHCNYAASATTTTM